MILLTAGPKHVCHAYCSFSSLSTNFIWLAACWAQARVAVVDSRIADRTIRAPFSGIVGLRNLSVGALVRPGDPITTLDDDGVMKLEFSVPATYLEVKDAPGSHAPSARTTSA